MADPITMIATLGAGALQAAGTIAQGKAGTAAAEAERGMAYAQASEQNAVAQRDAAAKKREGDLLLSSLQANAAASGAGAADNTVLELAGGIARDANVGQREILRQGQASANMTRYQGDLGLSTARTNQSLSYAAAGGQLLSGVAGAFDKYGGGAPSTSATSTTSRWFQMPRFS